MPSSKGWKYARPMNKKASTAMRCGRRVDFNGFAIGAPFDAKDVIIFIYNG
jgi:hypothetical protein